MTVLNNDIANSFDYIRGELLKYAARYLANHIVEIYNDALEHVGPSELGIGVLALLQKLGQKVGPLTSLRSSSSYS